MTLFRTKIIKACFAGIVSGIVLGFFLKAVEQMTEIKVYTLLLNIDYFPLINNIAFSEFTEFVLHMIVSIVLSILFLLFLQHKNWPPNKSLVFILTACIFIGILLFPTTAFSDRTPPITSISAWIFWIIGHGLYGLVLGFLLRK